MILRARETIRLALQNKPELPRHDGSLFQHSILPLLYFRGLRTFTASKEMAGCLYFLH